MKTTPEMTNPEEPNLEWCEPPERKPEDKILVSSLPKSTTPHSDTDAHPENPGRDLFAANAGITPEQARFAYDSALEAPTQAVPCDSARFEGKTLIGYMRCGGVHWKVEAERSMIFTTPIPNHRYVTLSGTSRQERCCR